MHRAHEEPGALAEVVVSLAALASAVAVLVPTLAIAPGSPAERGRLEQPQGLPAGGWAAFLHLAGRGIHHSRAGSVQALDILSR